MSLDRLNRIIKIIANDSDNLLKGLIDNKEELSDNKEELSDKLVEEITNPQEPKLDPKDIPGTVKEIKVPKGQIPMFPSGSEAEALQEVQVIAPQKAIYSICPICKSKNDPVEKTPSRLTYRVQCEKCPKLYNRIRKLIEDQGLSEEEAINAASTDRYSPNILRQVWENSGLSDISQSSIEKQEPNLRTKVENILRYRLNVKRDDSGKITTDYQGFPIPLEKPKYFTTFDLSKKLRWSPDHLVDFLESKGFSPLPIGGMGKSDMPGHQPPEQEQTENENKLRELQVMLRKITKTNEVKNEIKNEIMQTIDKIRKAEAAGDKEKVSYLESFIKKLRKQLGELEGLPSPESNALKDQIENKINELQKVISEEQKQQTTVPRFKTSWLNVWNIEKIQGAIKERVEEIIKVIEPIEKAIYFGRRMRYYEKTQKAAEEAKEQLSLELKQLSANYDAFDRKQFARLIQLREIEDEKELAKKEKEFGIQLKILEKSYGKELDRFLKLRENILFRLEKAEERSQKSKEAAEAYADKFVLLTSKFGYKWTDGEEKNEVLDNLEKIIESKTSKASLKAFVKMAIEEEQLELWKEDKKKELEPMSGIHFFEAGKEVVPEPKVIEKEPEEETVPEPKAAPFRRPTNIADFGKGKGSYKYKFDINELSDGKITNKRSVTGKFQFTPGYRYPDIEQALESKIQELAKKHNISDNSYVKITVTSKDTSRSYSFSTRNGKINWMGTNEVKRHLVKNQPDVAQMLNNGLISLNDLVEINGKLYEKSYLEKGYGEEGKKEKRPFVPKTQEKHVESIKSRIERKVKKLLSNPTYAPIIENLKKQLESKTITEDEFNEKVLQEDIKAKKTTMEEEKEEFIIPPPTMSSVKPMEEKEMTKCPYKGCGASIQKGAPTCWKCKSPIASQKTVLKVVRTNMRLELESEQINPITRTKEMVTKVIYPPRYSLVTIELDSNGEPISAKCEQLGFEKREGHTKNVPNYPEVWSEAGDLIKEILNNPKYSEEDKKEVKENKNKFYELLIEEKVRIGEIEPEKAKKLKPWSSTLPRVTAPLSNEKGHIKPCKKCPSKVTGPFDAAKLKDTCSEIAMAIKSLTKPMSNVFPYEELRLVTEKEFKQTPQKVTETKPWWLADDKKASRMDKIVKLMNK